MESIIKTIALTPITINQKNNELTNVLEKIILWINFIIEYGTLFDQEFKYKNIKFNDNFDFTHEMRLASLGHEYKNWKVLPSSLHDFGESWPLEKLVLASNTGIVEWYCNKFGFSQNKYLSICNDTDIQILGAFYHRMKIIMESVCKIIDFFSGKQIYGLFDINKLNKLLSDKNLQITNNKVYGLCTKIKEFELIKEEIITKYLNLEKTTDLSQLELFILIKNTETS